METTVIGLEVLGVPNILPNDRIVDKLTIHFLRPRNGGGEVHRVIYPSHLPGQAFVLYEDPEVAARVSQRQSHVLEIDKRQFPLQVRALRRSEVDLPVEATVDVSVFPDREEVRQCLKSYGFQITDLRGGQVRVRGTFSKLAAFKARMERRLNSQTEDSPSTSSPTINGHGHSSGAISKHYRNSDSSLYDRNRSPVSRDPPSYAPPSPHTSSSRGLASADTHRRSLVYGANSPTSADSHDLQFALGESEQQTATGRTGRSRDRGSTSRSISLPRLGKDTRNTDRAHNGSPEPQPFKGDDYSPSKYQSDGEAGGEMEAGAVVKRKGSLMRRSHSASRAKTKEQKSAARQENETTTPPTGGKSSLSKFKSALMDIKTFKPRWK